MNTDNNYYNNNVYEPHPICEVELLGYAKNDIIEVKQMALCLSDDHCAMLSQAYKLLHQVQEYLFTH